MRNKTRKEKEEITNYYKLKNEIFKEINKKWSNKKNE